MKGLIVALLLFCLAAPAFADPVLNVHAAANAVWFDDDAKPSDFEVGATGSASLSPHISVVGGIFAGVANSYVRANPGIRITATDVERQDFSIGLGIAYQLSSESARPQEWTPNVALGWGPWKSLPRLTVGGEFGYGLESETAFAIAAARYSIGK
jgi:hypothetical protein